MVEEIENIFQGLEIRVNCEEIFLWDFSRIFSGENRLPKKSGNSGAGCQSEERR